MSSEQTDGSPEGGPPCPRAVELVVDPQQLDSLRAEGLMEVLAELERMKAWAWSQLGQLREDAPSR